MSSSVLRAGGVPVATLLALLIVGCVATGSAASFTAATSNPNSDYAFTALDAPGPLSVSTVGRSVVLNWSAGANGSGYAVVGAATGTSNSCEGAAYSSVGTATGTSFTDASRYLPQGTWFCYQVQTSYASWRSMSGNPTAAAQLGVVASSVSATNGGVAGRLDTGDVVTITFNQPIATATGPSATNTVCAVSGSTVVVGATATSGTCSATETNNLGTIAGGSSNRNVRWNATWVWSNGNRVLSVTLGPLVSGSAPTTSGSWTFYPVTTSTKLRSATGSFHICDTNTGGGNCLAAVTGNV